MPQAQEMTLRFVYTAQNKQQMDSVIAEVIEGVKPSGDRRNPVSKQNGATLSSVLDVRTTLPLQAAFKSVQQIVSANDDVVLTTLSTCYGNEVTLTHKRALEIAS